MLKVLAIILAMAPSIAASQDPIAVLATGQSNFVLMPPYEWTPDKNAWLWDISDGDVGRAFIPLSRSTVNIVTKFASDVASRTGRKVCLINVSSSGKEISHWLPATKSPDIYETIITNVPHALRLCGAQKIDVVLWWQGEADQIGSINKNYTADFMAFMNRLWLNSWLPRETPIMIHSIAAFSDAPVSQNQDPMNEMLKATAQSDGKFTYFEGVHGATYWDSKNLGHMSAFGYFVDGAALADKFLTGFRTQQTSSPADRSQ